MKATLTGVPGVTSTLDKANSHFELIQTRSGPHHHVEAAVISPFRIGLINPDRALGRSLLLLISLKLSTLSGTPPFFTNSFWLASLLALIVGLDLSFPMGALTWFIKITKVVSFKSVEVFRMDPFLALYFFSLFISGLHASLSSSVSSSIYADNLTIWFSPSVPTAVEATQEALIQLEHWSDYWCFTVNLSKCETFFFSVDPHQVNLHPHLLLFNPLRFNPTPTFLGVIFDRTLSSSKHVFSLKAKFFLRLKALHCISYTS